VLSNGVSEPRSSARVFVLVDSGFPRPRKNRNSD